MECVEVLSGLAHDEVDGLGKAGPVRRFLFELGAARRGERIELGLAAGFAFGPFGLNPPLLFKAVQSRIERALLYLEHFAGDLLNALGDGPAVHGFRQEGFEDEEIERTLDEITWLSHT